MLLAENEATFFVALNRFQEDYADHPAAVEYVVKQWVEPYKEKFICAWTNNIMHYDNTTTNRYVNSHYLIYLVLTI